jgi:23S rRNA-/tRNA-specific pseudouridylate synthase
VTLRSQVKGDLAGKTLLDYLCIRFPYKDRGAWLGEILAKRLSVDGKPALFDQRLGKNTLVSYTAPRGWMDKVPDSKLDLRQKLYETATPTGKDSATRFIVKEALQGYTLFQCQPLTGRTNQIRVHLEALGLPLAGDKLYGRTDDFYIDFVKHVKAGGGMDFDGKVEHVRHLLHAWKLGLRHPVTGERMLWEAPVPKDMEDFIAAQRGA